MIFEINLTTFSVKQQGFKQCHTDKEELFLSPGLTGINKIEDIVSAEYGQVISVKNKDQQVSFARDYLGHYPLLYAAIDGWLFISDEIKLIYQWLCSHEIYPVLNDEAVALYLTMGYVPQGMTLFNEIYTCENASIYHCKNAKVTKQHVFKAVEIHQDCSAQDLKNSIETEVAKTAAMSDKIDIWCSGGLDSSILAKLFNEQGRQADLLSISYDRNVIASADSELRFSDQMTAYCKAKGRYAELNEKSYVSAYQQFISGHHSPVVDIVVPPKYALASHTRQLAITGEGGDPIFSGVKNNTVLYMHDRDPSLSLGYIYAYAHKRLFESVDQIMTNGVEHKENVITYFDRLIESFPGDINRKMFYLNTFVKQGGMIFPKNYYAAKRNEIEIRHPLTGLSVYETGFSMADKKKYIFPVGKLALIEAFKDKLPEQIIKRQKSGTRLPLKYYMSFLGTIEFDELYECGIFQDVQLKKLENEDENTNHLLVYGLITLNRWLKNIKREKDERLLQFNACCVE